MQKKQKVAKILLFDIIEKLFWGKKYLRACFSYLALLRAN